jgi:diguanylate cyclase (GGDEF)-like protein
MESVKKSNTSLIDPRDLLRLLRRQHFSLPFNLSFYSEDQSSPSLQKAVLSACCPPYGEACCTEECLHLWQTSLDKASLSRIPQIHRCKKRFLGFVMPVSRAGDACSGFLLGGGLLEKSAPAALAAPTAPVGSTKGGGPATPTATVDEAAHVVKTIFQRLPRLLDQQLHPMGLARMTKSLESARLLGRDIAQCRSAGEALGMTAETLAVLFDVPRVFIRIGFPTEVGSTRTALGFTPEDMEQLDQGIIEVLTRKKTACGHLSEQARTIVLSRTETDSAYLVPLTDGDQMLGLAALLDVELHPRDQALCDLILDRLSARFQQLKFEENRRKERGYSAKLISMISALSMIDSQKELFRKMLEMSTELCNVESGSLMLLDQASSTLSIAASKGMSSPVAKSIAIQVGEGIAGRVVQGGLPLMVNDIEKDERIATRNRPRFKTKSFLCLPLKTGDQFVGVLNLADKADGSSFTEADLNLLQSFVAHAVQLIERTAFLERVDHLEKLSITDSLTGLYNRRFLKNRLEEEINRSNRQKQRFSLVLADLDNFKTYNDVLGHLAGDKALQKVAEIMRNTAREMDIVTRYGGEEFCLILPGTGKKECLFVAERLRRAVEAEIFPGESHLPLGRLTISLGVSAYPDDGEAPDQLIHAADLALYRAKHNGRNRLVLYQADLSQTLIVPGQAN